MDSRRNFSRYGMPANTPMGIPNRNINPAMIPAGCKPVTGGYPFRTQNITAYSLSMVYAPKQSFDQLYDLHTGLQNGTIFKELNLPFAPGRRC